MKLGIFTDSHYSSKEISCKCRYNSRSLDKIRAAYRYFAAEGCQLAVCLGDLIDREAQHSLEVSNLRAVSEVIKDSGIPTLCIMGNHDAFSFYTDEFYSILGETCRPRTVASDGVTLVCIDTCYFSDGSHYRPGDSGWKDTFFPHKEQLRAQLEAAAGEVILLMHQNIDPNVPQSHRLSNEQELRDLLEQSSKVTRVLQGHYHKGQVSRLSGIEYVTYPAMCELENAAFVLNV